MDDPKAAMRRGIAPLAPAGPGQPIAGARPDVMELLSTEAKALVLGPIFDMRAACQRGGDKFTVQRLDSVIRRLVRGLYEYELRREDSLRTSAVDIDTTR